MKSTKVDSVRLSYGSAVELGLVRGLLEARPTTLYVFFKHDGCRGSCAFCPQPSGCEARISRIEWPEFSLEQVGDKLRTNHKLERICIQCSDEPYVKDKLPGVVRWFRRIRVLPISVCTPPPTPEGMLRLRDAGADIITIPIDCASERLFSEVKGNGLGKIKAALGEAVEVFGRGHVWTHIIVGLGEEEREAVRLMVSLRERGIMTSLFAFTPVKGSKMEDRKPPILSSYRRLQVARHLIMEEAAGAEIFEFGLHGEITDIKIPVDRLNRIMVHGDAFMVRGCPGCNRPYFNERVKGLPYNYAKKPEPGEVLRIKGEILG